MAHSGVLYFLSYNGATKRRGALPPFPFSFSTGLANLAPTSRVLDLPDA